MATFKAREDPPLPLVLLDNIPTDSFEKELFFQSLGKRGFDLICYSGVLVRGKTTDPGHLSSSEAASTRKCWQHWSDRRRRKRHPACVRRKV